MTLRRTHSSAFTLIEMVASLALAAMLMVALLNVIVSTAHAQNQLRSSGTHDRQVADLAIDLLRHDLMHARMIRSEPNELHLRARSGLDPATGEPTHRPVQIAYELITLNDQSWLVRTQRDGDDATDSNRHHRLVLANVTSFEISTPPAPGSESPASGREGRGGQSDDDANLRPDRVHVHVILPDSDRPLIDQTLLFEPARGATPNREGGSR